MNSTKNYISFFPRPESDRIRSLPPSVSRTYISTPSGQLELLYSGPSTSSSSSSSSSQRKQPILFAHGGCSSAAVWITFLEFFAERHDIPCYAISYRGHGASWYPGFLRMFFTGRKTLAADLAAGVAYVKALEQKFRIAEGREEGEADVVLVAHSNAGGLAQTMLDQGILDVRVAGLALLAATPSFGSVGVNMNWSKLDPWFSIRMFFRHLGNPMSPLSSDALVKQAFFCDDYPIERVGRFRADMPTYESFAWPLSIMFRFCDRMNVISRITGWTGKGRIGYRMLVLGATEDKLMTPDLTRRTAVEYRESVKAMALLPAEGSMSDAETIDDSIVGSIKDGVRYDEVAGAGHHLQNDLQWETSAEKVLGFYNQL